jgi:hypothetical protein
MLRLPGYKPEVVWVRMRSKSAEDGLERRGILLAETEESRSIKGTRKVVAGLMLSRRAGRLHWVFEMSRSTTGSGTRTREPDAYNNVE